MILDKSYFIGELDIPTNNVNVEPALITFIEKYISFRGETEKENTFIYLDPPYLCTGDNYSNSFTEQKSIDLFDCLEKRGCKFAMSEFNNPFILNQAKERGLNIITIGERNNLKNRRTEILVTNYKLNNTLF